MRIIIASLISAVFVFDCHAALRAQTAPPPAMFPFVIPWDDAAKTITDVSALNPAPLDDSRRIVVKDGHFRDLTGRRVRFIGTNFTFNANFPEKADAEKVAARMHKYGFNIVRLHHMDFFKAPNGIFDPKFPDMQHLDAEQLDRLDYLIYQFKLHGIYVDVNLHVSRAFTAADGLPATDKLPELGKVTVWFEPTMIELQKDYARDLLTHLNPYTKTRYVEEPAVALIEINNEDTLLGAGFGDTLTKLPAPYQTQLITRWNSFLMKRYGSTEAMRTAWRGGNKPLGADVLQNSQFADGTTAWSLEAHEGTHGGMTVEDVNNRTAPAVDPFALDSLPNGRAVHLTIDKVSGTDWHLQFHQTGLDIQEGQTYTVQFWARANAARTLPVYTGLDIEPWRHTGLEKTVELTPRWKRYTVIFTTSGTVPKHNRLSFVLGKEPGDVWLAELSLRPGLGIDVERGKSLETSNISLPDISATPQGEDYVAFLMDVERDYASRMRDYIKNILGARAAVTCSQASYGGLGGVWREANMEYVDMHAYWQHPQFPHQPWDPKDWIVKNTAMIADPDGGTLPWLAMHRVEGKPFTVSEYNHAAPNDYTAETLPVLASYAAWQDWDGFFLFDYNGSREDWKSDRIKGFFSIDTHPAKMALMPAAAAIFLRGYLAPVKSDAYTLVVSKEQVIPLTARFGDPWHSLSKLWGEEQVANADMLSRRIGVRFEDGEAPLRVEHSLVPTVTSGWFDWNTRLPLRAVCCMRSPGAKAAVGFLGGTWTELDELSVAMEPTPHNFAALTLTAMDGKPVLASDSLLLTAVGDVENTGMVWNQRRDSVGDQWGHGPTLAEGIPAKINLRTSAKALKVYSLDGTGARVKEVPSELKNGRLSFRIGPEFATVWYEIAGGTIAP